MTDAKQAAVAVCEIRGGDVWIRSNDGSGDFYCLRGLAKLVDNPERMQEVLEKAIRSIQARTLRAAAEQVKGEDLKFAPHNSGKDWAADYVKRLADQIEEQR